MNFIIFTLLFVVLCGWLDSRIGRKSSQQQMEEEK